MSTLTTMWDFLNARYRKHMGKTPGDNRVIVTVQFDHVDGRIGRATIMTNCSQKITHQAFIISERIMKHRPNPREDLYSPELVVSCETELELSTKEPIGPLGTQVLQVHD